METLAGSTIGEYKLIKALGSGPTGEVYSAEDNRGASCAVKVLHKAMSLYSRVNPFWEQVQAVAGLGHPNIAAAQVGDWHKSGRYYMVMPLLPGRDLAALLDGGAEVAPPQLLVLMTKACQALEAAHAAGLPHGAIKPQNLFLVPAVGDGDFDVRLLDFCTASLLDSEAMLSDEPEGPGVPVGAYLAPEQLAGEDKASADIYALGAVMFRCLAGKTLFTGSPVDVAEQQEKGLPELPSDIPAGARPILLKALALKPADRYASPADLRAAVAAWAEAEPGLFKLPARPLLSNLQAPAGVSKDEDRTVRVPIEQLQPLVDAQKQEEDILKDKAPKPTDKAPQAHAPMKREEEELAAIAAMASGQRPGPDKAKEPDQEKTGKRKVVKSKTIESFRDGDGELVELPLERSVKAFVQNLPAAIPAVESKKGNGSNETLDAAIDQFIEQARAWSAALPPMVVKDQELETLARPKVKAPAPAPVPVPEPVAAVLPVAPPEPASTGKLLGFVAVAAVIGGLLTFGGMKLFGPGAETGTPVMGPATIEPGPAPSSEPGLPAEPPAEPPAAAAPDPATAPQPTPGTEPPATEPGAAPADPGGPTAAPLEEHPAPAEPGPASPTPEPGATPPPAEPVASPMPAEPAPTPAAAPAEPKEEPTAKKTTKRPRKPRPPKPAAAPAAAKPAAATKPKDPEPKKGKSDWVDPFSQ